MTEPVTQQQETVTKQKNPLRIEQGKKLVEYNAGINLTGYHPPGHPGAFAPKCVPSPGAFAQQKMPGGQANKG